MIWEELQKSAFLCFSILSLTSLTLIVLHHVDVRVFLVCIKALHLACPLSEHPVMSCS